MECEKSFNKLTFFAVARQALLKDVLRQYLSGQKLFWTLLQGLTA
jgi:hypothetical protein